MRTAPRPLSWLAALVGIHLLIAIVHGAAHSGAAVALSASATAFVWVVIMAGPLAGLFIAVTRSPRSGAWIVALTMAGALVFGVVNHFVVASPDHVLHVAAPWRLMFGATAVGLTVVEAVAMAAGVWSASTLQRRMS
jgi:hypothetical protein